MFFLRESAKTACVRGTNGFGFHKPLPAHKAGDFSEGGGTLGGGGHS